MYKMGFVTNIVLDGKIMDDENGTVALPFGSEYKLRFKNKNTRDAVAKVYIDGKNATEKGDLIIHANDTVELERYIESLHSGNKFRFVSLDDVAPAERGNPQNGIVEIRFRLVKEFSERIIYHHYPPEVHHYYYPKLYERPDTTWTFDCSNSSAINCSSSVNSCFDASNVNMQESIKDVDGGKTVAGGYSSQGFNYGYVGELEYKETVIKLKLVGYPLNKTLSYKGNKLYCTKCGDAMEKQDNFCSNCGNKKK